VSRHNSPRSSQRSSVAANLALVAASVLLTLLGVEAFARLFAAPDLQSAPVGLLTLRNFVADRIILFGSWYPSQYDPELGWVPKAGFSSDQNIWGKRVSIDDQSLRRNGDAARAGAAPPVLFVGDSFVFGDEVDDDETLPAHLEQILQVPVLNGGVFGYGIDQSVLRAERLASKSSARALVLGFIPDDIARTNISVRTGVEKPYFQLDASGELVLHNVPTSRARPRVDEIGWTRSIFGYSYFADWLMRRLGKADLWYIGGWRTAWVSRDMPRAVATSCKLLARVDRFARERELPFLAVAEYAAVHVYGGRGREERDHARALVDCARASGVETLDLLPELTTERARAPDTFSALYAKIHLSSAGNRWVAERIAAALRAKGS
jgi:hypothetical protein